MSKYELTEESFNSLLEWLGDGKDSGKKYEEIRFKLIKYFSWNKCPDPEEMADKAINIVASKLPKLAEDYKGDPASYFLGVARKLIQKPNPLNLHVPLSPDFEKAGSEPVEEIPLDDVDEKCREDCLRKLSEEDRKLIIIYCQKGNQHDEDFRKALARELKMTSGALRVKIARIRKKLKECLKKCKKKS